MQLHSWVGFVFFEALMSFIGLLYIFFGALGQYLVSHSRAVSLIMVLASFFFSILFFHDDRNRIWRWFAACILINIPALIRPGWYFYTIPAVWNTFFGGLLLVFGRKAWDIEVFRERERRRSRRKKSQKKKEGLLKFYEEGRHDADTEQPDEQERQGLKTTRREKRTARRKKMIYSFLSSAGKGFVFIFAALMLLNTFAPQVMLRFLRDHLYHTENVTAAEQTEEIVYGGARKISNIQYDTEAPNGFLDITYAPEPQKAEPMTVIFIHGGGFVWGDKSDGDPNARVRKYEYGTIANLTAAGYNVVSMNYALTPEYTYPTAIKQLNRGLRYLKNHAEEWGLNMRSVALAGVSAGGNLEGVLVNIQTNPVCAVVIGEEPVFTKGEVKGVIFESSLLDYHRFGETHNHYFDYLFYTMGRVYFHVNDLKYDKRMNNANIAEYITDEFPPAFLSDGNTGTFYEQAFGLYEGLTDFGVYAELNYYPREEAGILRHGFEEDGTEWSRKTMQRMIRFLRKIDE